MQGLKRLDDDWRMFKQGPSFHDCSMEEVGVCAICESYQDMEEDFLQALEEARALLPGYLEAQNKQRLACTCREMDQPLRIDLYTRIVSFAALVNDTSN